MSNSLNDSEIQQAIAAVTANQQSPEKWIALGNALQARGEKDKAAYCFAQARTLSRGQSVEPPQPPTLPSPPAPAPAVPAAAPVVFSGALLDRLKQTASQAAQKAQEVDWASKGATALDKAKQAAQVTAATAIQAQQFIAENQGTIRQAGQTAVNTTEQVGRAATTISSATVSTAAKAGKAITTFQIAMMIIAGSFFLCALSGVAYVILIAVRK
jgi:hypothetical protein